MACTKHAKSCVHNNASQNKLDKSSAWFCFGHILPVEEKGMLKKLNFISLLLKHNNWPLHNDTLTINLSIKLVALYFLK